MAARCCCRTRRATSSSCSSRPAPERLSTGTAGELARLFLRLGVTAVGGPAAHVAMMHDEVVRRRGWATDERFVDLVGATNLIPGPNSTELAMHLGWDRGRARGLLVAGVSFIAPAALIVVALAWAYVRYGDTPAVEGILYGVEPVVVAIIGHALVKLLPAVARSALLAALAGGALVAWLLGVPELLLLAAAAIVAALPAVVRRGRLSSWVAVPLATMAGDHDVARLFVTFLRIGATLYGSGYVLLAFLRGDLVDRLGWITDQQLLDAIAIGQATPGPVFTTATFLGYVVAGWWGALVATVGIFVPSFAFVALLTRLVDVLRRSASLGAALDGVNAASVGLLAAVGTRLAGRAVIDPLTFVLLVMVGLVLWRTRVSSAWLVGAGALVGLVHTALVVG